MIYAVLAAGALLVWPALLNGFPIVFIDTVSYLLHTTTGEVPWDKTQAYGPFLHLFHWERWLWAPVLAQGIGTSWLIWLMQRSLRETASPLLHLLVCGALAGGTAAPWVLATLMPDALTAWVPMTLFLLAQGQLSRGETIAVAALASLAIAAHLSHLPLALAMLVLITLLTRRAMPMLAASLPLALALLFLCTSSLLAFGRFTPSPHGAAFLLARLQADGPATVTLREQCPAAGWRLCGFLDRLPMDSDTFLWDATSPLNQEADGRTLDMGAMQGAAEAGQIVAATLRTHFGAVAWAAAGNAATQLTLFRVGDTLGNAYLAESARRPIAAHFPPAALDNFDGALQMQARLEAAATPFLLPHVPVLLVALTASPWLLWRARKNFPRAGMLVVALGALLANAAATGALSKPHHRYQSRIVWLLPLAVALAALPRGAQTEGKNRSSTTLPSATV